MDARAIDVELGRLRERVAQLEAGARVSSAASPRRRVPRRALALALVLLLTLLTPLGLRAATPFNDLTGGVHDANIQAIYDAGITKGCVPNASYCPTANVTRQEMASFLARTAGLGTNPPVANAKTATNATNAQTAQLAQTVPDGAITAPKLSGAGSSPGQALISTGGGVTWQTLPRAPSFGGTKYVYTDQFANNCTTTVIAAQPLTVTTPSRIFALGSVNFKLNVNGATQPVIYVLLRNAANTATLGTTPGVLNDITAGSAGGTLVAQGIVGQGTDPNGYDQPLTVASGQYLLQFVVETYYGAICGGGRASILRDTILSYQLTGTAP